MSFPRKHVLSFFFFLILVCFAPLGSLAESSQDNRELTYQQLELFANAITILQENYIEQIDVEKGMEGAINGMLQTLDPHSAFYNVEDFQDLQSETRGTFSGIGIEITIVNGTLTIVSPIEGTPGDKAGLRAHDIIIKIDDQPTRKMSPEQAIKMLKGRKGSTVKISIHREGWNELHDFTIVRDIISIHSVKQRELCSAYGYIRITNFQTSTTKDFREEVEKLRKNKKFKGLIIDLRNNPGGLLNQAISFSDLFLRKGKIVITKGRTENQNQTFTATSTTDDYDFPLVILVNEGTASASEIFAGAMQDHKRAIVIGTRTFGKGSIQSIIPLPNGTGLKVTTARYYTPGGRSIQESGITPDIIVRQSAQKSEEPKENKHILREEDLKNHIVNADPSIPLNDTLTDKARTLLENDTQLQTAYNILKSITLYNESIHNRNNVLSDSTP